jgi:DNA repair protein RadC
MNISVFRLSLVKDTSLPYKEVRQILTPADVADLIRIYLKQTDREHFVAVFLDSHSKVIGINTVSIGTLTESLVHPREVFKGAILANASSIVCAHNHPSGIASASAADISVTSTLVDAGRILGIRVEDHVIIGDEGFTSFREEGLL